MHSFLVTALIATFLATNSLSQIQSLVPGRMTARLLTPTTIRVNSTAKALVTFTDVPEFVADRGKVYLYCEYRTYSHAGNRGGPRGYIAGCTRPERKVPLSDFIAAGSTVELDITKDFAGDRNVFFHPYVAYENFAGSSNFVNGAFSEPFDVERK